MNPYELFNLPQRFEVDEVLLHKRFIEACSVHHPDRFTDPMDQADAAERSAELNAAYQTLSDPERRADCLLALLGGAAKEQDKSLPDDLLLDMMQMRERMELPAFRNKRWVYLFSAHACGDPAKAEAFIEAFREDPDEFVASLVDTSLEVLREGRGQAGT